MRKRDDLSVLNQVRVVRNCPASWRHMDGDNRIRYCSTCNQNVYNILGMSAEEAAELIRNNRGRLCLRLYRRPDGTVITKDCTAWSKYGLKLCNAIAPVLAFFGFAALIPQTTTGDAAAPPERQLVRQERRVQEIEQEIRQAKSPKEKEKLRGYRKHYFERIRELRKQIKEK